MPVHRDFLRAIELVVLDDATVRGDLEDDYHRFGLTLTHDGRRVTSVDGEAIRYPWTTCDRTGELLRELVGMPLSTDSTSVGTYTDARHQCMHLFDLAGLAVAQVARSTPRRRYDISVPRRVDGRTHASIARDGELVVAWDVIGDVIAEVIAGPEQFAGRGFRGGFHRWARGHLDPGVAEAAIALRRAVDILVALDQQHGELDSPAVWASPDRPICHTFRPGIVEQAVRPPQWRRGGADWSRAGPLGGPGNPRSVPPPE